MSLRIGIVGYGRMGQAVEKEAQARGHEIVARINRDNFQDVQKLNRENTDCIIEFTRPEVAMNVYSALLKQGLPVVTGTTGWYNRMAEIQEMVVEEKGTFLYASNFSIGVNVLFELNQRLAAIMDRYEDYDCYVEEAHHKNKQDGPSGTAISLANHLTDGLKRKDTWVTDELAHRPPNPNELSIGYVRAGGIIGEHKVTYTSEVDEIQIRHNAFNRRGFALGAVVAAEWLQGKNGFFEFADVLRD